MPPTGRSIQLALSTGTTTNVLRDSDSTPLPGVLHTPSQCDQTHPFMGVPDAQLEFDAFDVGPFRLHCKLGQGGMGVIFGAVHSTMALPVAIKVITRQGAEHPRFRQALVNEIKAVCALNHPAIVRILDQGVLPEAVERATNHAFKAGTPYFAMEYVPRGTLADIAGRVTWKQAKAILLTVLDALAHAHAMDVIHRDIKPTNILLGDFGDRVIPKIADFGLAFATEDTTQLTRAVGSPHYMAPEQISQPWRKHGPWSDLYALGCVAFELITGRRAYSGGSIREIIDQHLQGRRHELLTMLKLPDGAREWLEKMLALNPEDRFRSAAEAARALLALDDATLREVRPPETTTLPIAAVTPTFDVFRASRSSLVAVSTVEQSLQEIPDHWLAPVLDRMPLQLIGAGMGVMGMRTIPLVGRLGQLNAMWEALLESDETKQVRTVLLEGPSGAGRTRLAEAFAQRVKELALANVLRISHTAEGAAIDGIAGMVARHFRTLGANPKDIRSSVRAQLKSLGMTSAYDVEAMCAVCEEAHVGSKPVLEFSNARQRHTLVINWLRKLTTQRPVLILIDDLQYGLGTLDFLDALVKDPHLGPILVVATWRLDHASEAAKQARAKVGSAFNVIEVPPLNSVEQRELVEKLAPLDPELTFEICERTAGNPRFAVELITEWVERGYFEVSPTGFRLREGATPEIPASLQEVWRQRLLDVTKGDASKLRSLKLAAAFGLNVYEAEWEHACALAGLDADPQLITALITAHLVAATKNGWSIQHVLIRDTLQQLAADQWVPLKRICADVLLAQDTERVDVSERLGRYLVDAEAPADAVPYLWHAAEMRRRQGLFVEAQQNISWLLRALDATPGECHAQALALRARTYLNGSEPRNALEHAERALELAEAQGDEVTAISALTWRAMARQMLGDSAAIDDIAQAYNRTQSTKRQLPHHIYTSLAFMLATQRRIADARDMLDLAFGSEHSKTDRAMEMQHRTRLEVLDGQWEKVLEIGPIALDLTREVGRHQAMTSIMEYIAEAHRKVGNLDAARDLLERCIDLQTSIGSPTAFSHANLGSLELQLGHFAQAEMHYLQALHGGRAIGRRLVVVCALGGLLAAAAGLGQWSQASDLVTTVRVELENGMIPEPDLAAALEIAGDMLTKENTSDASAAFAMAIVVYQRAGKKEAAAKVQTKLDELDILGWEFPLSSEVREDL